MKNTTRRCCIATISLTAMVAWLAVCGLGMVEATPVLVGLYSFEGTSPTAFDDVSGQGLNPTTLGSATLNAAGYEGQAAEFVGGTALSLPLNINPTVKPTLTLGAWVKADSTANRGLFGHDDGAWDRGLDLMTGTWRVTGGSAVNSGLAGSTTDWQFVALTYDGPRSAVLYVDDKTFSTAHSPGGGAPNMVMGAYTAGSAHPFDGLVDNFFIFDGKLNPAMINTIRTGGMAGVAKVQGVLTSPMTVIFDQFDDTDGTTTTRTGWNTNGIGSGFEYLGSGTLGTTGENSNANAGTGFLNHSAGDWAQSGVTSKDSIKILNAEGTTDVMWSTRRVFVDTDQNSYLAQAVGGERSDWRFQHGIISTDRDNTARNDLWANPEGGLYLNLFYERETSATAQTLMGNIRAATSGKAGGTDTEGSAGLVTLATFNFGSVLGGNGGQHLAVDLETDADGWAFTFVDGTGSIVPTLTAGSLSGGWIDLASVVDTEVISFTDEFLNGAYVFSEGGAMKGGRGSGVLDSIYVSVAVPEPSSIILAALGLLGVAMLGRRRREDVV